MEITQIGICIGCSQRGILSHEACTECQEIFGERCGLLMQEIRSDPAFARKVYNSISRDGSKQIFIKFFGIPEPCKLVSV